MSNELTTLLIAYPVEARSYECTRTEQRHSSQGAHGSSYWAGVYVLELTRWGTSGCVGHDLYGVYVMFDL